MSLLFLLMMIFSTGGFEMASDKKNFEIKEGVNVTEEVIAIVAGLAATEVDGVSSLYGNLTNAIIAKTGMNKLSKAVKVLSDGEDEVRVQMSLNMAYGFEIPTVSAEVQKRVKSTVENMTGLTVREVDIRVASVDVSAQSTK